MTPAELEVLLRRVLGEGVQLNSAVYLLLVLVSLLGGTLGAFVGAYSKKRGENLATKADFDAILKQLAQQTQQAESIKAEIAQIGWIEQRRWDLKRQLYWDLLQVLQELRQKGRWFSETMSQFSEPSADAESVLDGFAKHMYERGTVDKMLAHSAVATIVVSPSAAAALDRLSQEYNMLADTLIRSQRPIDAFFHNGRYQLWGVLARTDEVYELVLAESQADLLGGAKTRAA